MNIKRLSLAILAAFATIWLTDFLIHGLWLAPIYKATASLWRPEAEMQARIGWLFGGEFLAAVAFVLIWARSSARDATLSSAMIFGLSMGLFSQAATVIGYAVQDLPPELVWRWVIAGMLQGTATGVVTFLVYKPKSGGPA